LAALTGAGERSCRAQQGKCAVRHRPGNRLHGKREERLNQHRIGQQRQQRSEVGERKQPVRRGVPESLPEPGLHQRTGGGQQEILQADGRAKQSENQESRPRVALSTGFPVHIRNDGQQQQAGTQQNDMQPGLAARRQVAGRPVSVGITEQQHGLKKNQAGGPYRSRAAEPWQDLLGNDRLDQEQQEGAEENGSSV
jgi:hypothetical protein